MLMLPAPRHVPDAVMRAANPGGRGRTGLMIFVAVFGSLFVWAFFPVNCWRDWVMAAAPTVTTTGQVIEHKATSLSVNEQKVYRTTFEYRPEGVDAKLSGKSYNSISSRESGMPVTVEYLKDQPSIARVRGERQSAAGSFALFVLLFPLIPVAVLLFSWRGRRRKAHLLRNGERGSVKVEAVEATNMSVNDQPVFRVTFTPLHDALHAENIVIRRHDPALVRLFRRHLEDQKPLAMLYDPAHPKRMLFPDALDA